jgi:hypothetical protein
VQAASLLKMNRFSAKSEDALLDEQKCNKNSEQYEKILILS